MNVAERKDVKNVGSPLVSVQRKSYSTAGCGSAGAGAQYPGHRRQTRRRTLALLLPAQVPAAGAEGNALHLLVRPHPWILNSYVKSSLCIALMHALPT